MTPTLSEAPALPSDEDKTLTPLMGDWLRDRAQDHPDALAMVDLVEAGLPFMMAGSAQGDGCQDPQDAPDE